VPAVHALAATGVPGAGLPPLTLARALTAWTARPAVLAGGALLGGGYLAGVRRVRAAGRGWSARRTTAFVAGTALLLVIGSSFVAVYDDTLFWTRAAQNVVLLMVTPLLLAMGSPVRIVADLMSPGRRARWSRRLHSPPLRALTFPLVVTVVLVLPLLVLYLSPLYELTLRSAVASGVAGTVVAATGFVYFWTRFRLDPTPRTDSYLVTLSITIVEMIGDAVLGVVLWLGPLVAAGWYASRGWGPDLRTDQLIGAGILWIGGDVIGLPFILVVLGRFRREDESRAKVIDAELDEQDEPGRLWWEDDPVLSQRFKRS
jgi:cytochrome c oxidase assembly factor CtaG